MASVTPAKKVAETSKQLSAELGATAQTFQCAVAFPTYCAGFFDDRTVVLGGGGGSSKTGVQNRLTTYSIDLEQRQFNLIQQFDLSKEEDAPMSLAIEPETHQLVAGINSSVAKLNEGVNENLRVFEWKADEGVKFIKAKQTIHSTDQDHYQKVTTFTRSAPHLLAIGSSNSQLSVLTYPALDEVYPSIEYDREEMFDVDFDDSSLMIMGTSSQKLRIWSTKPTPAGETQEPLQTIERPVLKKELACTFRAAKFGRKTTKGNIYTVVNATPSVKSRKAGPGEKKSFVSLWDTKTWKLVKTRTVSQRPLTAFDISADGLLLAYGSSDMSVGILDATTLRSIMTILRAHEFPVTSLRFNPCADLVVTGSVDNTVRIIRVPALDARGGSNTLWTIILTVLILILALILQQTYASGGGSDFGVLAFL